MSLHTGGPSARELSGGRSEVSVKNVAEAARATSPKMAQALVAEVTATAAEANKKGGGGDAVDLDVAISVVGLHTLSPG